MTLQTFSILFADQLLKGAAILVLASLASGVVRHASAARRNALWLSAFIALLLLPFTYLAQPQWSWRPTTSDSVPMRKQATVPLYPVHWTGLQTPQAGFVRNRSWDLPDWRSALLAVWGAGVVLLTTRRLVASWQLRRLSRSSEPVPPGPLSAVFSKMAKSSTRPVRLRISPACQGPMTWGILKPIILLPREAEHWPEERLRIVFDHELSHIVRWDAAARLLAQAVCAIHWFNPLVWMAARQLRLTQEQACDDRVLLEGVDPATYAAALVESVRRFQRQQFEGALAMAQPSTLETRVGAIMDGGRVRDRGGWLPALAGGLAVSFTLLASALAQVSSQIAPDSGSDTAREIIAYTIAVLEFEPESVSKHLVRHASVFEKRPVGVFSEAETKDLFATLQQVGGFELRSTPALTANAGEETRVSSARRVSGADNQKTQVTEDLEIDLLGTIERAGSEAPQVALSIKASVLQRGENADKPLTQDAFTPRPAKVLVAPGASAAYRLTAKEKGEKETWVLVTPVPSAATPTLQTRELQTLSPAALQLPATSKAPETTLPSKPSVPETVGSPLSPSQISPNVLQVFEKPGVFRSDKPVQISGKSMSSEDGITVTTGSALLEHNGVRMNADVIRYIAKNRIVLAQGHVNIFQGRNVTETENIELNLVTGRLKITGPSKTRILK